MARKLRVQYPGASYHVMNRGERREPIFKDDQDRERFVETQGEACLKTGWQVQAYCLLPNHFHLVVETPQANLVAGIKWFPGTYTARFNRRHMLFGHLFPGRYRSLIVDGSGSRYLRTVCDEAHLNPSRAGLVHRDERLKAYRWSSWPGCLAAAGKRPAWLRVDRVLGEHGIPKDSAARRRHWEATLEARREAEPSGDYQSIRRGWCLGDERFRAELLAQVGEKLEAKGQEEKAARSMPANRVSTMRSTAAPRTWPGTASQRRARPTRRPRWSSPTPRRS